MTLASAINISLSGIKTSTLQLEQTASNVANAATKGYTAKTVNTVPALLGTIGGGVAVAGFSRSENAALFKTLTAATSDASYRSTQDNYLQQVMDIFGTSSSDNPSLSSMITTFTNAWSALASTPESQVNQRQVVSTANTMCEEIQRIAEEVEALDRQCLAEINTTISDLNSYLEQIRDLNIKISQSNNSQLSSGDLQDERDKLLVKVAGIVDITTMDRGNGQVALYTASGYQLVDGTTSRSFSYDGTNVIGGSNSSLSLNGVLSGGSLQALIDIRATSTPTVTETNIDTTLTNANSYLTQIQTLNATIAAEVLLGNPTAALEAQRTTFVNQLDAIMDVTITDNGDGTIDLTSEGGTTLLSGATIATLSFDGVNVTDSAAPTVSLNGSLTGGTLETQLASYRGIASASTDEGTNIIQKLRDQLDNIVEAFTTTVSTATSDKPSFATAYNSATTASGELASGFFTGTNRTNFSVNSALINGTSALKQASASGVTSALLDATRTFSADGLNITSASYTTMATASLVAFQQAASNIATLSTTAESSRAYIDEKLANETGVNTDKELVNLVEFQNAYAASAHVMSVVKELFQTLQNLL